MKTYTPAHVPPPGEILKEELEARGWSQADLAEILGRPPRLVSEIISGKRAISTETAQGLGDAFGVDPHFWLNLESAYQLFRTPPPSEHIARRAKLFEKAPIKELVRRHWIQPSDDAKALEANLLKFFGTSSLEEEPLIWPHAARKGSSYQGVTAAQWAWLCRARRLAAMVDAEPYSEDNFYELIEQLRLLLASPEDVRRVPRLLAEHGIRLVVIEHLSGTKIDGACFWLDKRSPVIVLSLRYDRIDYFWFTLFHELGHIKAKDGLTTEVATIDDNLVGQGATRTEEKPQFERLADAFAEGSIIEQAKLNKFIQRIRPLYYKEKIRGFAAVNKVHPGLVVGQLQWREEITYAHNREMLAKVRDIVTKAALTDGWGATPMVH
jgi:HTH-type transcriptional regulator / antitoxin HigA